MLLTCPTCQTRYALTEGALARAPKVRCTSCGETWKADAAPPASEAPAEPDVEAMISAWRADTMEDAEDGPEAPDAPVLETGDVGPVHHRPDSWLHERPATRPATSPGARPQTPARRALAFAVGGAIALALVGVLERERVVAAAPELARLYALAGMPVNLRGMTFENVAGSSDFEDGLPILRVSGEIRNATGQALNVPRLRLSLREDGGREIYAWTLAPPRDTLAPDATMAFRAKLTSPPEAAREVFVRFARPQDAEGGRSF